MNRLIPGMFLLASFYSSAAVTRATPSDTRIFISNITVINTETGRETGHRTIIVSGERIAEVKDSRDVKPPTGAKIVDGTGKYLIPGLWDMHVHAMYLPRLDSWMPLFVANGVLGIRDMGSPMKVTDVKHLREEIAAGSQSGPRIIDAGPILDGQKQPPPFSDFIIQVTGTAQVCFRQACMT